MEDGEFLLKGKPIQDLRGTLATLRRSGAARLKRVRRWRRWFVRGAIVGVIWAVLYAPQSGAETRATVGRLLRPLVMIGVRLGTWLMSRQHARHDQEAARPSPGRSGNTTQGWKATPGVEETSGAVAERERVEGRGPGAAH